MERFSNNIQTNHSEMMKGISDMTTAVKSTLGPHGKYVIIERKGLPPIGTKDGVSVAEAFETHENKTQQLAISLLKEVALKSRDEVGDGTTSATVMAHDLFKSHLESIEKLNSLPEYIRGIESANNYIVKKLNEMAVKEISDDVLTNIATISGNNDKKLGQLVGEVFSKVGEDGIVILENGHKNESESELIIGLDVKADIASPHFLKGENSIKLENAMIVLIEKPISKVEEILPVLKESISSKRPVLVVSSGFTGSGVQVPLVNHLNNTFECYEYIPKSSGEDFIEELRLISHYSNSKVVKGDHKNVGDLLTKNITEYSGMCDVELTSEGLLFKDVDNDSLTIAISKLDEQINDVDAPENEITKSQDLRKRLLGKVGVIKVGAKSRLEQKELFDRYEDAVNACRCVRDNGFVIGGGQALFSIANDLEGIQAELLSEEGVEAFYKTIDILAIATFSQMIKNSGASPDEAIRKLEKHLKTDDCLIFKGYDILKKEIVIDMLERGIIDPVDVVISSVNNSISVVKVLLQTECCLFIEEEKILQ